MAVVVTVSPDMYSAPLRVLLNVSSGSVNAPVSLVRVHADGSEYPVLTESGARLIGGTWAGYDYHAPLGVPVSYRAAVNADSGTSSATWLPAASGLWLIPADDPALAVKVAFVDEIADDSYDVPAQVVSTIGSPYPISLTEDPDDSDGVTVGVKASLTVAVEPSDLAAAKRLLLRGGPLLIQAANQPGWDVTWRWIQPTGTSFANKGSNDMPGGRAGYPFRYITIPYQQIAQPDVGVTPLWTAGDAYAYWSGQGVNAGALVAKYATALDFKLDNRVP